MHLPLSQSRAMALGLALVGHPVAPAVAHEFWIEPEAHEIVPGDTVAAELRVGQMLSGEEYPYLSDRFIAAQLHSPGGIADIEGMEGDLPALSVTPGEPGLHVIAYHAIPHYITYDDLPSFVDYLAYEGLAPVAELHKERGLADSGFSESYIRNARSLVQAGPPGPEDIDRPTGMPFELVALGNPFAEGLEEIGVRLTWNGEPVTNRQVAVFQRPEGAPPGEGATRSLLVTDAQGQVALPLGDGGFFLLNAVQMKPVEGPGSVVWESHWATLTFALEGS